MSNNDKNAFVHYGGLIMQAAVVGITAWGLKTIDEVKTDLAVLTERVENIKDRIDSKQASTIIHKAPAATTYVYHEKNPY